MFSKYRTLSLVGLFILLLLPTISFALLGDADGNGVLDLDDSRIIARFVVNQIPVVPNPGEADATQDGVIDMVDAFVIAQKVSGQSRIIVVAPYFGYSDELLVGDIIRIQVFERFFPLNTVGGTVRIQSASTGYDSGELPLVFEYTGLSLYYHWNTAGLASAADYAITISLTDSSSSTVAMSSGFFGNEDIQVTLTNRAYEQPFVAWSTDAYCPAPGIPLEFRRVMPNDHAHYPNMGPFGSGWAHNYDMHLTEFTDGRVAYHGPNGFNRLFESNADGTYNASPGDYGVLTRDVDGTFQLKEKSGLIYQFRSDLRFDYMQDLNGNRISAIYDGSNRLIEIRHSCGKSFFLEYNGDDHISQLTDHAGRVTTYEYTNPFGFVDILLVDKTLLWKMTDPAGKTTEYQYIPLTADYILNSRLISIAYPDGTQTSYEYDSKARLSSRTETGGANPITYTYDADGTTHITDAAGGETIVKVNDRAQIVSLTRPEAGSLATPWQMQYDTSANLAGVTDPLGHAAQMTYDAVGDMEQFTNPLSKSYQYEYDLRFNKVSKITDPLNKNTVFAYDDKGNLTNITYPDPAGSQLAFTYDAQGSLLSFQDPALKTTEFTNNALGQVTTIKNALNDTAQFAYYDDTSKLQSITDAEFHTITYGRDLLGRLIQRTYPDGSHEDYSYDDAGKVTAITNRRGEQIAITYNATGRPAWKNYASGKQLHAIYDSRGLLDRVERVEGSTTTLDTDYDHDLSGRLTLAQVPQPTTGTYDVAYTYDTADNPTSVTYPDGYVLNYEYDAVNRLTRIADGTDATVVAYQYDDAGRRTRKTLGNGTYVTYAYDELDRLTLLVNHAPDDTIQSQFAYTYNAGGVVDTMTTLEGTHIYTYDDTYQLTSVTYPDGRTVSYTFDKVGNRKTVTDDGTVTNYNPNQLNQYTQVGAETITYDTNGNMLTRTMDGETITYTWDEDDRLVAVDRGGTHIDYRYDHQGRLVGKNTGSGWKTFLWDGLDLIAETDASGSIVKRYVYGSRIDEVALVTEGGTNHWVQRDGMGSAVGTTDDGGAAVSIAAYNVYGELRSGGLSAVPQRLSGMIWDEDAGLYYVRARWQDPILGRFMQIDPMGIRGGINEYLYTLNNPINFADPTGKLTVVGTAVVVGGTVIVVGAYYTGKFVWRHYRYWAKQLGGDYNASPEQQKKDRQELYDNFWDFTLPFWESPAEGAEPEEDAPEDGPWSDPPPGTPPWSDPPWGDPPPGTPPWNDPPWSDPPWNNDDAGGGQCPTFIQLPTSTKPIISKFGEHDISQEGLASEIMVPTEDALLRSDIPIFGVAGGKNFKSYRVEYGKGYAPKEWHLIKQSTVPQSNSTVGLAEMRLMQGDLDIRGNLSTWNSGLKNWEHLPWHPPEDPTDFNGVYTIRLMVEGKDGEIVEDRVTGEVGRVIAQCRPGVAESADKRVRMHFAEQSLTHPFRVYTIIRMNDLLEDKPAVADGNELIGPIYRIREPGDRFTKAVVLEFKAASEELAAYKPDQVGIARYDSLTSTWQYLPTGYRSVQDGMLFSTELVELPESKAIFALVRDPGNSERSQLHKPVEPAATVQLASAVQSSEKFFVHDTFETDTGSWKPRDRFVGGAITREKADAADGSQALKISNVSFGGNFSVTVLDQPFDVSAYPLMSFDYRIAPGVKTDFYLRLNGRWYNLGFTDDPVDFQYRDVNIANLGRLQGIITDDKWHSASVDLSKLLRVKTRHTIVDEIMMADWNVGGYMKLEFGQNPREATYYIDNFKISRATAKHTPPPVMLVDDFNDEKNVNRLGEKYGVFNQPNTNVFTAISLEAPVAAVKTAATNSNPNRAMLLHYDTTQMGSYGGYWTSIQNADLTSYSTLAFKVHAEGTVPKLSVGLMGMDEKKRETFIRDFVVDTEGGYWKDVKIPLTELANGTNRYLPKSLYFSSTHDNGNDRGTIWVDDLRFEGLGQKDFKTALVTNFESPIDWEITQSGAAAMSAAVMPDIITKGGGENKVCRISYGGTIGRDYGLKGGFSYANWSSILGGIDARPFTYLMLKIRGEHGGETPDFYLRDANKRVCIRASELESITSKWQDLALPLAYFEKNGIDTSRLESLDISFQWKEQAGTIYVDDIRFSKGIN